MKTRMKTGRYMQNFCPFSTFRWFMPEKLPFFLISRIRAYVWKITPFFRENGYKRGIRFDREWGAGFEGEFFRGNISKDSSTGHPGVGKNNSSFPGNSDTWVSFYGAWNPRQLGCLVKQFFALTAKAYRNSASLALCDGDRPAGDEFPSTHKKNSNAENVSMLWHHYYGPSKSMNANKWKFKSDSSNITKISWSLTYHQVVKGIL